MGQKKMEGRNKLNNSSSISSSAKMLWQGFFIGLMMIIVKIDNVAAFYLPGVAPLNFEPGEKVELKVNKLTSVHTQLPMDYYSLPFCRPKGGIKQYAENLGEFLTGDKIENSPYQIFMQHYQSCKLLCQVTLDHQGATKLKTAIKRQYHHNWIIDNLPAASIVKNSGYTTTLYSQGIPVGFYEEPAQYYVYNHVHIIVNYHPLSDAEDPEGRVVGFFVEPFSIEHRFKAGAKWDGVDIADAPPLDTCNADLMGYSAVSDGPSVKKQQVETDATIIFTYDIEWERSENKWASRWDVYLTMDHSVPNKVHWFSIFNSLLIVVFLTAMISMILIRNLHRDITRYNRIPTEEEKAEEREETGWKLVHADVFRPPTKYPMMFCVMIGTGVQLALMSFVTIMFAAVGFLSPANRGSLLIAVLLMYVMMGSGAGYASAIIYKSFKGRQWQLCTILTALAYPSICFLIFFVLNLCTRHYGSTQSVPFFSIVALLALWIFISVPLVFLGAFFGYKREAMTYPVVTSNIPRQIPDQPWFLWPSFTIAIGGILPFGALFVEMFFILSSIWMGQYYYVFGFTFMVFFILLITCADITMVFCYFQLCAEDYHWWWRSFLTAGSTAGYVFLYSIMYFAHLNSTMFITYLLYFSYMALVCVGMFLMCGCVGFFSCLWFNKKIYASIKVD